MKTYLCSLLLGTLAVAVTPPLEQLITREGSHPANHGSQIVELQNKDLLVCWFAGSKEAAKDVQIICSRKPNGSEEWEAPVAAVTAGETAKGASYANKFIGNPTVFEDGDGILWLFYEAVQWGGHSGACIDYKTSQDFGKTWSQSQRLVGSLVDLGHLPRNKALPLAPDRVLLPVYREFTSKYGYVFDLTFKNGEIVSKSTSVIPGTGHLQPALVHLTHKEVIAYLRDTSRTQVLYSILDLDKMTFGPVQKTNLPNPNSAVDALVDHNRKFLVVYNDSADDRGTLSLARSEDGFTFKKLHDFQNTKGHEYSYPALLRGRDGRYHLTYTYNRKAIKYVRFTSEWLDALLVSAPH